MKTLQEYILNFKTSLEESLLSDFDDLDKESDIFVNRKGTIGEIYEVRSIEDWDTLKKLNKSNLKKYPCYWDYPCDNIRVERVSRTSASQYDKPNELEREMINALLSFNFKDLALGEYLKSNALFKFFNKIFGIGAMTGHIYRERGKTVVELFMASETEELYIWLVKK